MTASERSYVSLPRKRTPEWASTSWISSVNMSIVGFADSIVGYSVCSTSMHLPKLAWKSGERFGVPVGALLLSGTTGFTVGAPERVFGSVACAQVQSARARSRAFHITRASAVD
eukprot:CAMPEP_0206049498 /NCGR_PEP_ID=MMETSP1466-20131121/26969_1 /ASSEMBLY_ACC=CAM_ASM_001126 /TAXON_ID=44452 /ORGANISM="Pavlova gyrans, Strain CCMP608" /LENGTH=113 /DNA_ID=CAMNT_0053424585 /DNA_START=457 /DNA_END=795 /DNA_ORIENTATION=+